MSTKYLLDMNLQVLGNLTVNTVINVIGEVKGIKPLSELIGKKEVYDSDLTLDTLVLSDKLGFTISVNGTTTCVLNADKDKLIE
tara:strand:+ start:604 stop:855 length:252 start_codon:yes stop_codon:yes gene_type:complete